MSYAPGSESAHMFHLSHHRLVRFCWLGLVVVGVCLCCFAFLVTTDQPARSSYQPMTIIAYLHDCHCRYDERSNVQKKKVSDGAPCLCIVPHRPKEPTVISLVLAVCLSPDSLPQGFA